MLDGTGKNGILPLAEEERAYKRAYQNGGQWLLEKGMTFSEYEEYVRAGDCIQGKVSHYYKDMSENRLGNTIKNVEDIANGSEIHVSTHVRYSYPVMHNHAYIEVIYIYSGSCVHFVEQGRLEMKEGDICILAPNTMHALSVTSDDTFVINIMLSRQLFDISFMDLFRGGKVIRDFFDDIFYRKNRVSPYVIYPTGCDPVIRSMVESMFAEIREKRYAYERSLWHYVHLLFIHLIRRYEMFAVITTPAVTSFNNNVVAVLGYLSMNYYRTNLNETAAFFGYSPSYLGKTLKKYTGMSYTDIVLEYQLENARKMLDERKLSITEISQEVGCFDASHLTRKFKKKYGVTPKEYRQKKKLAIVGTNSVKAEDRPE